MRYAIEIQTTKSVFGTCVDAVVTRGPSFARGHRGMAWAPTHREAYETLTANIARRWPEHAFSFTHTEA